MDCLVVKVKEMEVCYSVFSSYETKFESPLGI